MGDSRAFWCHFLLFWNINFVISTTLFYLHRDVALIYFRDPKLSLLISFTLALLVNAYSLPHAAADPGPYCLAQVYISALAFPLLLSCLLLRFMQLSLTFWKNQLFKVQAEESSSISLANPPALLSDKEVGAQLMGKVKRLKFFQKKLVWMIFGAVVVTLQVVCLVIVRWIRPQKTTVVDGHCSDNWMSWPLHLTEAVLLQLFWGAFYAVRQVRENYGIKLELYTALGLITTGWNIISLSNLWWKEKLQKYVPTASIVLIVCFCLIHFLIISIPALRAWNQERERFLRLDLQILGAEKCLEDQWRDEYENIWRDNKKITKFREFMAKQLKMELILFLERVKRIQKSPEVTPRDYQQLYDEFLIGTRYHKLLELFEACTLAQLRKVRRMEQQPELEVVKGVFRQAEREITLVVLETHFWRYMQKEMN